ncbi:preprotein translocase subunit SecD, partial [Brachyspira pilosicoli]
ADSVKAGTTALFMAAILVAVFMIALYRVSGVLSTIAMLINVILIIAILSPLRFTLTLPGIAGLILTIGMAVDANVIIFERIKDELKIKSNISDAIISGYDRAFATIFDSNITTIIVALILWIFGSGPVQGFAVTLFFGILINLFTAVFITRYIYEEIIRTKLVKKAGFFFI